MYYNVNAYQLVPCLISLCHCLRNKANHPILSNSHPSATANKATHSLNIWVGGGGVVAKPTGSSYNFDNV